MSAPAVVVPIAAPTSTAFSNARASARACVGLVKAFVSYSARALRPPDKVPRHTQKASANYPGRFTSWPGKVVFLVMFMAQMGHEGKFMLRRSKAWVKRLY